ncbi:MAG: AAA family ATPase [Lachnospiraceae bacterium]|nr:AAA family ATPase [Lachnospiraceae bacterium]
MKNIFTCRNDEEVAEYLRKKLDEYRDEGGELSSPDVVYEYLRIMMHYVLKVRPFSEQSIDSILKLLGASYSEKGFHTPFWAIIREEAARFPEDEFFYLARSVEAEITNDDIDEIFALIEKELLLDSDRRWAEEKLGLLSICRIRYQQNRIRNIRMRSLDKTGGRSSRRSGEAEPVWMKNCRKFAEEYTPARIKAYLDRFVLGQEESKEILSTSVYNHFLRILHPEQKLIKTNILMVGPSGCGKTELIRRIADLVPVPVVITDFSGIVATPWKGRNKEEALLNLYLKAGKDPELTECGIVFCDEFDKIIPGKLYSKGGDINQELQGQLLGMFEGTEMDVPLPERSGSRDTLVLDTTDILFICAGAFEGLEKIARKDYVRSGIGFGSEAVKDEDFELTGDKLKVEHLMEYGMKPELAGRLSSFTVLRKLNREMLKRVLTEAEDSILSRYEEEIHMEGGAGLQMTDGALDVIIDRVMEMSIGARGLNAILHEILQEVLYELPSMHNVQTVLITEAVARMEEKAIYL